MHDRRGGRTDAATAWLWIAFVAGASLGLSRAFACAMPVAAIAVAAALTLPRRLSVALVLLAWSGNQAIGFALMHYPHTASTVGWGATIGVAALAALGAAWSIERWVNGATVLAKAVLALAAAYAAYELVLLAATLVLPSGSGAFTSSVVSRIFGINAVALGLLLAAHQLAQAIRLPSTQLTAPRGG